MRYFLLNVRFHFSPKEHFVFTHSPQGQLDKCLSYFLGAHLLSCHSTLAPLCFHIKM